MLLNSVRHTALCSLALTGALMCCACSTDSGSESGRVIVVPSTATTSPSYRGDGSIPTRRYVVRMSDGKRDWEVEFPEVATGYELRIPLGDKEKSEDVVVEGDKLTAADKQLLGELRKRNVNYERQGIYKNGKNQADPKGKNQVGGDEPGSELNPKGKEAKKSGGVDPWAGTEDKPAPTRRSYFLGLEKVKRLYRGQKFELAIVFLKKLEKDYPNDVQIMSMMGTLWLKMGQKELARQYWEKVLAVDPQNKAVIAALKQLNASAPSTAPPVKKVQPKPKATKPPAPKPN